MCGAIRSPFVANIHFGPENSLFFPVEMMKFTHLVAFKIKNCAGGEGKNLLDTLSRVFVNEKER